MVYVLRDVDIFDLGDVVLVMRSVFIVVLDCCIKFFLIFFVV